MQIHPPMSSDLSITIHNIMPEKPSEGVHVPFHTMVMEPFRKPFTFGPKRCDVKNGSHIGLESDASVAANFVGTEGQFLVMSSNQFVILSPKAGLNVTVGTTLFPKETTHTLLVAEKEKSYPITVGTVILAYNFDTLPSLKSITVFMGANAVDNVYHSALGAMSQSLVYFNAIWKAIADERGCVKKEAFKPVEVGRERYADMLVSMNGTTYKPPLGFIKPAPRTNVDPPASQRTNVAPKAEPLASSPNKRPKTS